MFKGLPGFCYSTNVITQEIVLIRKGEKGYYPVGTNSSSDKLNAALGINKAQESAMVAGSIFGWEAPASNPQNYDVKTGQMKRGNSKG